MEYEGGYNEIDAAIAQIRSLNFHPTTIVIGGSDYRRFRQRSKNINLTHRLYALARKAHRN